MVTVPGELCSEGPALEVTVDWSASLGEPEPTYQQIAVRAIREAMAREGIERGRVELFFVDDEEMRELNREYRKIDATTDVLSFPLDAAGVASGGTVEADPIPLLPELGSIVVSFPRAKAQAEAYGHSLAREIGFLVVHGALHLCGYDHDTPVGEREMRDREEAVLGALELSR
ncbi:MAG TPA: rRNA maturation RNase YbeY [Firmicutes bacterium]|nr:rRNA maturation RNase YbeY [Bacillota bacterium]